MNKITSLTDIVSIRTLEKIQDNFSQSTGIGCVMRNLKGEPITKFCRPSRLWLEVMKHPDIEKELEPLLLMSLDKCMKSGQVQIFQRYMDTYIFVVPVGIDGRILGFLVGGLVRLGNPNIVNCTKEAARLDVDLDTFLEMYLELSLMTKERLEASANLFRIVASSLSSLAKEGNDAKARVDQMVSLTDILEKEVEMASLELKESEERYRRLFNTINDGVYEVDTGGRIKDINPGGARMLGYSRSELIGSNMRNFYVNAEDSDNFVREIIRKEHIECFHPYVKLKNGQKKYFETNSTVIKEQYGRITGIQGIFRDISHRNHNPINTSTKNVIAKTPTKGATDN